MKTDESVIPRTWRKPQAHPVPAGLLGRTGLHQDSENPERPSSFDPSKDAQIEPEMLWEGSADSWCPEATSAADASFPGPGSIFTVAEGLNYSTHGASGSPLLARGELENWSSSFVSKEVHSFCWVGLYLGVTWGWAVRDYEKGLAHSPPAGTKLSVFPTYPQRFWLHPKMP